MEITKSLQYIKQKSYLLKEKEQDPEFQINNFYQQEDYQLQSNQGFQQKCQYQDNKTLTNSNNLQGEQISFQKKENSPIKKSKNHHFYKSQINLGKFTKNNQLEQKSHEMSNYISKNFVHSPRINQTQNNYSSKNEDSQLMRQNENQSFVEKYSLKNKNQNLKNLVTQRERKNSNYLQEQSQYLEKINYQQNFNVRNVLQDKSNQINNKNNQQNQNNLQNQKQDINQNQNEQKDLQNQRAVFKSYLQKQKNIEKNLFFQNQQQENNFNQKNSQNINQIDNQNKTQNKEVLGNKQRYANDRVQVKEIYLQQELDLTPRIQDQNNSCSNKNNFTNLDELERKIADRKLSQNNENQNKRQIIEKLEQQQKILEEQKRLTQKQQNNQKNNKNNNNKEQNTHNQENKQRDYQKLQEKLTFLQNRIQSVKQNIHTSKQEREIREQQNPALQKTQKNQEQQQKNILSNNNDEKPSQLYNNQQNKNTENIILKYKIHQKNQKSLNNSNLIAQQFPENEVNNKQQLNIPLNKYQSQANLNNQNLTQSALNNIQNTSQTTKNLQQSQTTISFDFKFNNQQLKQNNIENQNKNQNIQQIQNQNSQFPLTAKNQSNKQSFQAFQQKNENNNNNSFNNENSKDNNNNKKSQSSISSIRGHFQQQKQFFYEQQEKEKQEREKKIQEQKLELQKQRQIKSNQQQIINDERSQNYKNEQDQEIEDRKNYSDQQLQSQYFKKKIIQQTQLEIQKIRQKQMNQKQMNENQIPQKTPTNIQNIQKNSEDLQNQDKKTQQNNIQTNKVTINLNLEQKELEQSINQNQNVTQQNSQKQPVSLKSFVTQVNLGSPLFSAQNYNSFKKQEILNQKNNYREQNLTGEKQQQHKSKSQNASRNNSDKKSEFQLKFDELTQQAEYQNQNQNQNQNSNQNSYDYSILQENQEKNNQINDNYNNNQQKFQQKRTYIQNSVSNPKLPKSPTSPTVNSVLARSQSTQNNSKLKFFQKENPQNETNSILDKYKSQNINSNYNNEPYLITNKQNIFYINQILKAHTTHKNDNSYIMNLAREHLLQSIQGLSFVRMLKPIPLKTIQQKSVYLPKTNKKTIVFDLDETLIHCNESAQQASDVVLPIKFPSGDIIQAGINIRPFTNNLLKQLHQDFEIIIFTASHSCYANVVLDYLDPQKQYISHRLYREHCVQTEEGVYVKDLRIDNASYSFGFQLDNGIPIIPFYDFKQDQELKYLLDYLNQFKNVDDVRTLNKSFLKLHQYDDFQNSVELVQSLYNKN
ncbi:HAD-like domain [Pseudocohnilembus persalinus]|uniref:HAD-like domain n=1 Tax=Pseudocohnilembus persalinus TaxID=266149 RepID=A0A0V0R276_PSEPJ|nr:HAD-like domain [Pseudocohnilembus persalinus]|eukprot:KRX08603.1 HAD-like domain [Pseudocohnilembus persalinus]